MSKETKYVLLNTFGVPLLKVGLRILGRTIRIKYNDPSLLKEIKERHQGAIFAFWHCDMLMIAMASFREHIQKKGIYVLASRSRDGELLARIVKSFGISSIRGSSSRGGTQGLLQLNEKLKKGNFVAVAVDGPRGPRFVAKSGVTLLAKSTGLPIFPLACQLSKKIVVHSWDKTEIPLPACSCVINIGKPIYIPSDASSSELAEYTCRLETILKNLKNPEQSQKP